MSIGSRNYSLSSNGEHSLILDDGTRLTLSRKYKDKLFELLGKPL